MAPPVASSCPNSPTHSGIIKRFHIMENLGLSYFDMVGKFRDLVNDYPIKLYLDQRAINGPKLRNELKKIIQELNKCTCAGVEEVRSALKNVRENEFQNLSAIERYIIELEQPYLSYKYRNGVSWAAYGTLTADMRSKNRGLLSVETALTHPIEYVRDEPKGQRAIFAFREHTPGRSFWKAFAHSYSRFGHENSWPVAALEVRQYLDYAHTELPGPRTDLYNAFARNSMVYGTPEEIEQMRPRNTMLHRSCFEDVPINIFMAQVVADLYQLEVVIVMPLWEGKYHPVLIRGVKSGEQALLHIDEKGEWHSIRPLVRIPRHYRFPTPIQDCNTPVEDKEDWSLQEGLHMQLSRCPYVKYPFMKVVEPLDGLADENDRLNLIMFKLDAPLRTKPYFPPVTVERVQVLRRVAWDVRPLLLPPGQTETDDEKIPENVFEERDQEDIEGVFPFPFDTPLGSA